MNAKSLPVILLALAAAACTRPSIARESLRPIPEQPPLTGAPEARGSAEAAARIAAEDRLAIVREVVRHFFRPLVGHARWIDPQPLSHSRAPLSDSTVAGDEDWAIAIVDAVGLTYVCPLTEANSRCLGRPGGVLRFSSPYAVGADSAVVYARYRPVGTGVVATDAVETYPEMEFRLGRVAGGWSIATRRSVIFRSGAAQTAATQAGADVVEPARAVEELLAVDRAFATAALRTDLITALTNMFAADVVMPAPGGHVRGSAAAAEVLRRNADNARSTATWTPVRGGVSSDGLHGFTVGYMRVTRPDGTLQSAKYVAYWVKGRDGWRVAVYRRVPRAEGPLPTAMLPPSLPVRGLARGDAATVRRYEDELRAAELAFSADAGPMGLGPAFAKWGAPDAVNVGGPDDAEFVRGPDAIARSVSAGVQPNTAISWAPTDVRVSSTGDLGVSIGTIRIAPVSGAATEVPFFTIWKRATPNDVWRYVAE